MANPLEIHSVARDAPVRLSIAAKLAFPDGTMTSSGLRKEAAKGRLVIERIAGKDFTTLENIDRMRELCRVKQREQDYGCVQTSKTATDKLSGDLPGSSSTEANILSQDALRTKLRQQRNSLRTTSRKSISPSDGG